MLEPALRKKVLRAQKNEITEHRIYTRLASASGNEAHRKVLLELAGEELAHYRFFRELTGVEVSPDGFKTVFYIFLARVFGLNFGLKLMEKGEDLAGDAYEKLKVISPKIEQIILDEEKHEHELLELIDEERLKYAGSIVLGLNDALVELTGALAGFTLAIRNTGIIAVVGLITGIAASMSMAASEYISTKHEGGEKSPLKSGVYTGIAYVGTVSLLILPYLLFKNIFLCLGITIANALLVIFIFTFYISVAKDLDFRKRFLEMAGLSVSVAAVNFFIGLLIRNIFGVDI
jgi:VIT1/CCC1 family predicted Fe2+/Mn2+ transporter